jgi:hypothetical protein
MEVGEKGREGRGKEMGQGSSEREPIMVKRNQNKNSLSKQEQIGFTRLSSLLDTQFLTSLQLKQVR